MARIVPLAILVGGSFVLCIVNQRSGHDWGDDFALYLRQSQALVEGNVGEVLASNRMMVQESSGSGFSPYSYPWGAPLLLAPVVALFGLDFAKLKLLETLLFVGFLIVFYRLVLRRAGRWGALGLTAFIGLSPTYISWTDTVLAEIPFLLFVALSLLWLDRCRERGLWEAGPIAPLVVGGVLIAFTFSVRREGIALVLALVVAHVIHLRRRRKGDSRRTPIPWRRLGIPYASAVGFVIGLQLVLPSVVFPQYDNVGLHNLKPNAIWFRDILGEHLGIKDLGNNPFEFLGSQSAGLILLTGFLVLATLGVLVRLLNDTDSDAPWLATLLGIAFVVGSFPYHEGRYIMSIVPYLMYFAYQGIASTLRYVLEVDKERTSSLSRLPTVLGLAFILVFTIANGTDLYHRTEYRLSYDYGHWGPEDPVAQEMFEAVRSETRRGDIVSFFRARAMALYTDRASLQLTTIDHILDRADWYLMEKGSTYSQVLLTDEEAAAAGLVMEWENDKFVLWWVPDR